ncbi:pyridoxal phosphate-dependent aminotransferase [Paenibacillus thiaminolyticus]|uniref:Pyridoxal phosphate-dependent aminotransferase n=1 Tax=Paenibacillus thiaminolyticus TaxID=49283 RepID=A0AAP9J033_PANTH|nr:pyridoxal phosphate-dependent aminotransferase [Paenibacillus thiaminolyticus]MCY9538669.1 pyridoxal phosphate-dependent aminotransferase [Paenibacillus thiaminolyticus]MCY9602410.1 pyridoxal phosphate-dependent aminotransferase [Paenibacillus thiaminolyticus]MCY9610890.1 pyridoxal phosphate-dependent aminotransferase [Paenibacillus thiaminolyticus]MCY9613321.1 pyridoxal phosphate-dependent aminotransferase [Paenibacillus thiaminolyticus]MCY9619495.1 pyridoxal phosphate-dependent aminotrans
MKPTIPQIVPADRMNGLPKQFFATLVARAQARVAAGHDVINLGQGNPDLPTSPHIVAALQEAAANPLYHRYPPFQGYRFLKEAVAERYMTDYSVELDADTEVAVLFGGKTGLVEINQILLNPGDVCLVPDPGYPDYWSGVALAGAEMVMMPLLEANGYLPDYERIDTACLERAKLMFLNYPNNPTSAIADRRFYEETIRFAERNGIVVASDFAYGAIGFDGHRPISFLELPGAKEVGVEFYTMSKTYNMAGWRVAFAVGNAEIIRLINLMQDHMYVSLFGAVQAAAAAALTGPQDCVRELCGAYESRRNALYAALHRIGWNAPPPAGSFFCWLPVPAGFSSASFADLLLEQANVVTAPGIGFGGHGEGYVRLGLLAPEERLIEAAERIGALGLFGG